MSPLRVVHVIGGGDTGGAMAHLVPLLTALRRAGCDARLLCLGGGGLAEAAAARDLPVEVLPMSSPWDPRVLPPLHDRLDHFPWDVVHTHGMRANLPVRVLSPLLRRDPCLFTTVHSDLSLDYPWPVQAAAYRWLDRVTVGRVDQMICVSDDLRRRLAARPHGRNRPLVVSSGLEAAAPDAAPADAGRSVARAPDPASGPEAPMRTGSGPGRTSLSSEVWRGPTPASGVPRVGTVTRLVPVKDLDLFLDVVDRVRRRVPEVRVAVVGGGPEAGRLQARSAALGLEGVVEWSGEVRPGSVAVGEFDVFLLTSSSEGVPVSVLEAMAAGVPVVAAAVGGLPEVVQDGVTGRLVPVDGERAQVAGALADSVVSLLGAPAAREAMGRSARDRVRQVFSVDVAAERLLAAYDRCVAGRHHSGPAGVV